MLVLTRTLNENIWIGNDVRLTILDVRGRSVRIGIEAPKEVIILREELYLPKYTAVPNRRSIF